MGGGPPRALRLVLAAQNLLRHEPTERWLVPKCEEHLLQARKQ